MKNVSELAFAVAAAALVACSKAPADATHGERGDPMRCASCHMPEFKATTHPPHEGARPTTCGVCHEQTKWHGWRVDHPFWELTGAHARAAAEKELAGKENQVKCFWCHRGDPSTFKDTKKDCIACHEDDRARSHVPGHRDFAATCQDCHSTETWKGAKAPPRPPPAVLVDASAPPPEPPDAGIDAHAPPPKPTAPRPTPTWTAPPKPTVTVPPKPTVTTPPTPPPDVTSQPSRHR